MKKTIKWIIWWIIAIILVLIAGYLYLQHLTNEVESILAEDDLESLTLERFYEDWTKASELNGSGMTFYNEDWTIHAIVETISPEEEWFTSYHDYEKWIKASEWRYINWAEEWEWKFYHENWQLQSTWKFVNWAKEWEWKFYHENWQLEATHNYKRNKEQEMAVNVWENITYREDGTISSILTTDDDWTMITRTVFDENWKKSSEMQSWMYMVYYDEDGKISGVTSSIESEDSISWELWYTGYYDYEKWIKSAEWKLVDWVEEWEWIRYYENWNISYQWNLVNWLEDGIWHFYYESWTPYAVIDFTKWEIVNWERYNEDWSVMTEDEFNEFVNSLE